MRHFLIKRTTTNAGPVIWNPENPNHQDVRPGSLGLLQARDRNAPLRPPMQRLVEVRNAGHMGLGLFAKEKIPRGARILAERPLFAMPDDRPLSDHSSDDGSNLIRRRNVKDLEDFVEYIAEIGLDSQVIKEMETLFCEDEEAQDEDTKEMTRVCLFEHPGVQRGMDQAYFTLYFGERAHDTPQDEQISRAADRYARLHAIWLNNRIKFGEGATMDSGVFRLASRINHSCCPNAWYDFNPDTGNRIHPRVEMLTTHAIRDIAAGDQIFVGYDAMSLKLREQRTADLETFAVYGCVCALCTDPLVEALQRRAYVLWQPANHWVRSWPLVERLLVEKGIAPCKNAFEALKMGEEVIALLTHPAWNVRELALAEAYKLCSIICERIAMDRDVGLPYDEAVHYWDKAMMFSGQKCQVYMIMVGTDGRDMKQADERLKELGERRARWTALQNGWRWPPRP